MEIGPCALAEAGLTCFHVASEVEMDAQPASLLSWVLRPPRSWASLLMQIYFHEPSRRKVYAYQQAVGAIVSVFA